MTGRRKKGKKMAQSKSAVGLDVGTSRIVAAQGEADSLEFASQLNAFVAIPRTKLTASVLDSAQVAHAVQDGVIHVHGDESERFADLMNAELRRPMTLGVLDGKETEGLRVVREIVASLLGTGSPGRKVCFSIPAPVLGTEDGVTYHESMMRHMLGELGYEAWSINEGLAVIYSELASTNYTGIGISCGGGLCNVAMAYLSAPILTFSVPKAGDYIDSRAASVTGERANRVRLVKEEAFRFGAGSSDKVHQVIEVYYDDMIRNLVGGLSKAFSQVRNMPRISRPVPVVLSGGTALPEGFRERFEKALRGLRGFPLKISEVRLAQDPLHSTAKGALIAALSEA
jgi:hypothetical protein